MKLVDVHSIRLFYYLNSIHFIFAIATQSRQALLVVLIMIRNHNIFCMDSYSSFKMM